jgi:hypothetical protein
MTNPKRGHPLRLGPKTAPLGSGDGAGCLAGSKQICHPLVQRSLSLGLRCVADTAHLLTSANRAGKNKGPRVKRGPLRGSKVRGDKSRMVGTVISGCDSCVTLHASNHESMVAINKQESRCRGRIMAAGRPAAFNTFTCPNCNALYQLVKGEAGPETVDSALTCRACGGPLPGREGEFVLKYFLLRQAERTVRRRA